MRFVVVADRRTGTSLLLDTINSHPEVECVKRAFGLEKHVKNPTPDRHSGGYFLYRTRSLGHRLRHFTDRGASIAGFLEEDVFGSRQHLSAPGFRLLYGAARKYPEITDWILENELKVVHLTRENLLKRLISEKTAPLHKMHHPREGTEIRTVKVTLDPEETLKTLEQTAAEVEAMHERFARLGPLHVVYEELSANREHETHRALDFLGVPTDRPVGSDLVKINPDSVAELVENHEELSVALAGTRFERFL